MSRGNARMRIFLDDGDYRNFVYLLGDVVTSFELECWSYCVMPNHYHVAVRTTKPNLSRAIQKLDGVYARWWNAKHDRVGHVFQGRFKDQVVQREGYLLNLCRYVALNPVRGGLVKDPSEWRWSSYAATAGLCPEPDFLRTDRVLEQFGEAPRSVLQARFVALVLGEQPDEEWWNDRIRSNERVLGDRLFRQAAEDAPREEDRQTAREQAGGVNSSLPDAGTIPA